MKRIYATEEDRRQARMARSTARRTRYINAGLNSKGEPRKRHVSGPKIAGIRKTTQAAYPAQTSEDFIAAGGHVEVIPKVWPTHYAPRQPTARGVYA